MLEKFPKCSYSIVNSFQTGFTKKLKVSSDQEYFIASSVDCALATMG
ncbi:MAG: hypothetical protein ACTSQP_22615 [Promethearchaeota archaeon]